MDFLNPYPPTQLFTTKIILIQATRDAQSVLKKSALDRKETSSYQLPFPYPVKTGKHKKRHSLNFALRLNFPVFWEITNFLPID